MMSSFTEKLFLPLCLFGVLFFASGSVLRDGAASKGLDADVQMTGLMNDLLSEDSKTRILSAIMDNKAELQGNGTTVSLRDLAEGDFDDFNALFKDAIIHLPPTSVSQQVLFTLTLNLNDIYCTNINVADINITYNLESAQRFTFQVDVIDLAMDCFIEFDYKYGPASGKGNAQAYSDNNMATILFAFGSTNFEEVPPNNTTVESCVADVNVNNLDLGGDWISQIIDVFEGLLRGTVENQVQKVACDELSSMGVDFVNDALVLASDKLEPYLGVLQTVDPLAAENALEVPEGITLLNFQDTENVMAQWFDSLLQEADSLLGTVVDDDASPTGTGRDLGINVFLRKYVLDEDRAFVLNVTELRLENNGVLFDGQDKLTETTITLDGVNVVGLDTFTKFEPLIGIGNYTLQNVLAWSYITLELEVTIDMKPSSKEDSIIEGPSDRNVVEKVKISVGVDQLDAVVSFMLAIDQDALGGLFLGPLLDTSNLLPCLLSTVHAVELSELSVSVANIREPTLDGFVSAGIDRIVTQGVKALFLMYENLLIKALPNACETKVKELVNTEFLPKYTSNSKNSECPAPDTFDGFIDFRDLLLKPDHASISGGTGLEPYGDLASTLMTLVQDQFLTPEEDGLPSINSKLIRQFTETQSGVAGMLQFPEKLFGLAEDNAMGLQLAVSDLRLRNLDTLTSPLSIIQPLNESHVLSNIINIGPVDGRPLNGTLRLLMSLDNQDPALAMMNEMDISASVASTILSADLIAKLNATELMAFPVQDILNINCWLAKFPAPELDASGARVSPDDTSLGLLGFVMNFTSFSLDVFCVSCTSPGVAVLPDLLTLLESLGSISLLQTRLEYLGQDLIMSNWVQGYIDRLLNDAPKSCPHSPEYVEGEAVSMFKSPGFPSLSREGVETLVYAAAVAAQVGAVILAESHVNYDPTTTDKLSAQNNMQLPKNVTLLDLTAIDGKIGSFVDTAIEEINGYLGKILKGPNGDSDLAINVLIMDFLLKNQKPFSFMFDGVSIAGDDMEIALGEIRILGLDTFTSVNVLDLIAPQTIDNEFGMEYLNVELDVSIKTAQSADGEILTVSFGVQDINVSATIFLAIVEERLGSLLLGSILNTDQILPCLLSTAFGVELTKLNVTVGGMDSLAFTGFVSKQVEEKISTLTQAIRSMYGASMIAALEGIFDVTVRGLVNNWIDYFISLDSSTSCPELNFEPSMTGFVTFPDLLLPSEEAIALGGSGGSPYGDMIRRLNDIMNEYVLKIDDTTGLSTLNDLLIAPLTRGESDIEGTILLGDLLNTGKRVQVGGLDAQVDLKAYNARIENMESVGEPLSLLVPVLNELHLLNNTASFGVGPEPLRLGLTFLISLMGDGDMQIRNEVDITLDLKSATVAIAALVKIAEDRFVSFPMKDITNLNCWLATLPAPPLDSRGIRVDGVEPSASLQQLAATVASMNLNVTCVSCTSPGMEKLVDLLSTKEGAEDLTEAANKILDAATKLLGGQFLQTTIDRLLNDAPRRCPHRPEFELQPSEVVYEPFGAVDNSSGSISFLITLMLVVLFIVLAVALVAFVVRRIVRRRHQQWLRSLPGSCLSLMLTRQNLDKAKKAEINRMTTAMFKSTDIPPPVRFFMPVVILGNIALFLSGHLSKGATVNIVAEFGEEGFTVDNFFEFSMARSTIDIWKAGGKELAILIGLFSGVWPYTKQLITLTLWFLPPQIVTVQRRGSIFLWLDTLGKWSMVDVFVLVISIAAFQVNIESPDVAFLPEGLYSVSLFVIPLWGLYANMIAQLVSQVSSHFIIHYHRRIEENASVACDQIIGRSSTCITETSDVSQSSEGSARDEVNDPSANKVILRKHAFERPHRGSLDKVKVRRGVSGSLIVVALVVIGLLIAGCIVPSLSVEVLGVLGVAVESGQAFNAAVTEFNVFSLVRLLFDEARFLDAPGDYIGLGTLGILFVMTILVVPILQTLTLARQWFAPLAQKQRTRMSILTEILEAWQYVEVYLLALIVSAWQLGPISSFMINSYCDGLDDTFATLVYYGILKPVDAQCFRVQAEIQNGTFILIVASALLFLLHTFVVKAVNQYERDASLLHTLQEDGKLAHPHSGLSRDEYDEAMEKLEPPPVLFTDTFRWVMRREDSVMSSRTRRGLDDRAILGVNDRFPNDQPSELELQLGDESPPIIPKPSVDESMYMESDGSVLSSVLESSAYETDEGTPLDLENRSA